MNALERALERLDELEQVAQRHSSPKIDPRVRLITTLLFLGIMLSTPLTQIEDLILYFVFPILSARSNGLSYLRIVRRSLIVVPFVGLVALLNIFYDRTFAFWLGGIAITRGWITGTALILRGLLSVQAILTLIYTTGYYEICRTLSRLHLPDVITLQLLFLYRYTHLLVRQAITLRQARSARSYGRKVYPLKFWGQYIAQLFLSTLSRAEKIDQAIVARGFTGRLMPLHAHRGSNPWQDGRYFLIWTSCFLIIRFLHPTHF